MKVKKYVAPGRMIAVEGNYQVRGDREWFDARNIHILYSHMNILMFEHTHWWNTQISAMADIRACSLRVRADPRSRRCGLPGEPVIARLVQGGRDRLRGQRRVAGDRHR